MHAERICRWSYALLAVLLLGWYGWWTPAWTACLISGALLGAGALLLVSAPRGRLVWGGMVVLLTFVHGTTEAFASPPDRLPALLVVAASLCYFAGLWSGIRSARRKR